MIKKIVGSIDFLENLRGKSASFALSISTTKTCEIDGLTQAGIPGLIHLTPTLDAEFLCSGEVRSLDNIAETPKGVPTPALISRAVHLLKSYKRLEIFDLGAQVKPKLDYFEQYSFGIEPSCSIEDGANIEAKKLFDLGEKFASEYELKSDYLILGESVPGGTTTALTTALALGYECKDKFSSSFKDTPDGVKQKVVKNALTNIKKEDELFEKLSKVSDNMLIFNAGFVVGACKRGLPLVLAGGTQMACVLLIANRFTSNISAKNLGLFTTKWIAEDENSDIKSLLEMLDFKVNAFYADFDFAFSEHPALKLYDQGEAKEGVGAGACLVYGLLNGLNKEEITRKVESFLG
jgi:uncharacterized protein (TIGR00303 family)